jgi:hypothetical protein
MSFEVVATIVALWIGIFIGLSIVIALVAAAMGAWWVALLALVAGVALAALTLQAL